MMTSDLKPRYDFMQSDLFLIISIYVKKSSGHSILFANSSISVSYDNVKFELALSHDITPEESSFKVFGTKIELKCMKAVQGLKWKDVERSTDSSQSDSNTSVMNTVKVCHWELIFRKLKWLMRTLVRARRRQTGQNLTRPLWMISLKVCSLLYYLFVVVALLLL